MTTIFATLDELRNRVGQEVAASDWFVVNQSRINQFAEATDDRQWIHIDAQRAHQQSPYGVTVAHGFLTLALLSHFLEQAIRIEAITMGVNYGFNRVRFPAPVTVDARIRARFSVQAFEDIAGGCQITWGVVVEVEGADKPCCVAEWIGRLYR